MPEEKAFERIRKYGYEPLEPYINNRYRMNCLDSEGYIIKLSLDSLGRCLSYQRFSVTCNEENYLHNLNLHGEQNKFHSKVLSYRPSHIKNHVILTCLCDCGEMFDVDANAWRRGDKTRCNDCNAEISDLELIVKEYLKNLGLNFIQQKRYKDCRYIKPLPFDFYLPEYNCCVEVDGEQHYFENSKYFHNREKDSFNKLKEKDKIKTQYCLENNIKLIRLPYFQIRNTDKYKRIINQELNIC